MTISIIGRKMNISPSLQSYAEEKIGSASKVISLSPLDIEVVLRNEKNPSNPLPYVCEVTLRTKGHVIRVEEQEEDIHTAIDIAAAKVVRQLRKYKTRVIDKRIQDSEEVVVQMERKEAAPLDLDELMYELSKDDEIVRTKEINLEPLTTKEALIQIDLLGHDFFAYIDRDSNCFCVLYRRNDGGYGILKQSV